MAMDIAAGSVNNSGYNQVTTLSKKYRMWFRRSIVMTAITSKPASFTGDTMRIPIMPNGRSERRAKGAPINWQQAQGTFLDVPVERVRAWEFAVLDIDKVQSQIPNYDNQWAQNRAKNTKEDIEEEFFADVIDDADADNLGAAAGHKTHAYNMGTAAAPRVVKPTIGGGDGSYDLFDAILDCGAVLDEYDAPDEGRWVVVNTWGRSRIVSASRDASQMGGGASALNNGFIRDYDRFKVYQCNRLPDCAAVGGKSVHPLIFGCKEAIYYMLQMDNLKFFPQLQTVHGSGYASELLYDWKGVQDTAYGAAYWTPAS